MSTPERYLATGFLLNGPHRIVSTREPAPQRGPLVTIVRSAERCAWAVRDDLPDTLADALGRLARDEPPPTDLAAPPAHADRYRALVRAYLASRPDDVALCESSGPAFTFPAVLPRAEGVTFVDDERPLQRHFQGWIPGEIAAGRAPLAAVVEDDAPVSVCFCARRADDAAEAGLETAPAFRGRGYALRVTAAWAAAVRASGRTPLYSTEWTNAASRAVARRLGLTMYASAWSLAD